MDAYIEELLQGDPTNRDTLLALYQQRIPYRYTMDSPCPFPPPMSPSAQRFTTAIRVVPVDCLVAARDMIRNEKGIHVAVMNMANEWNVGGAFSVGQGSQEEYLFRNTTLGLSLWSGRRVEQDGFRPWVAGTKVTGPTKADLYPFEKCMTVYSPHVEVIAMEDTPQTQRFRVSVLTIAAQDLRKVGVSAFDPALLRQKLRTMLYMAYEQKCDGLILGALGCGAFLNPPQQVASIFAELLTTEYKGYFRCIDFAVIKSAANLKAFQEVFC